MTYERYKKILKDEILHRQRYQESKLSIDKTKKVPAKTEWTNIVNPKIDMKLKLKMNNGFTSFKDSKKIQPIKFEYRNYEQGANIKKKLMKKAFFMENPHLIEFAAKNASLEEVQVKNPEKIHQQDPNHLKWGRPFFGIYDRYGGNEQNCYLYSGPGNDKGIAVVGQYFVTDEPIRVERHGKNYNFIQKMKSIND